MPRMIVYITCLILFGAALPLPYGYYQFLRLVACGVFAFGAYVTHEKGETVLPWLLGGIALLFNPIFPVYLDRSIWFILDVVVALILLINIKKVTN